ncbi:MAG: MtnX-like HAD-IB family phosphatase [Clostridia bacterium]|jgi:2-hydroxy-3-keto-5-methylthiopentenyl-1-phosphate phosphatase|nr:MtnX-like HAD-IB family phosphatase [Clostridia bacterium]
MKRVFFTDFDGTITKIDTTDAMTETFAQNGWQEIIYQWEQGKLNTRQSAQLIFPLLKVNPDEAKRFLLTIPIDETFQDFVNYVKSRQEKLYILSDGFDFNIKTILEKNGLNHLEFYTNHLLISKNEQFDIETPHASTCDRCGTCKKTLVQKLKADAEEVIYIGDGISDVCGCQAADIVFAKNYLLQYRKKQGLPVQPYTSFADVLNKLQNM